MTPALRGLLGVLAKVGAVVAGVLLLASVLGLAFQPAGWVALGVGVAVVGWLIGRPAAAPVAWPAPPRPPGTLNAKADAAADAWAFRLAGARPGRAFSTRYLADALAEITAAKLAAMPGVDPTDVWASAPDHLSPQLRAHLATRDDPDAVPPPLNRRVLRSLLAELEDL
ncbi:hypothetical protein [Propioniciclava soli]|uniref:DUF4129 domain-containing protein n=1 Tax=Propioniciclava soli TaxID=2775081 RepID=A0ABZ3C6P4_9ACTN|nr:hypothetical protein [Propioniciclava soli]